MISIHAPVKGATPPDVADTVNDDISIHAPVKGATRSNKMSSPDTGISIHAPVKGATSGNNGQPIATSHFNPRTREGCDVKLVFMRV